MSDASKELIERIGAALPVDMRAAYLREMMYCHSLPENDEMLRILRIMQILTLLMEQVPDRVVKEREQLEKLFMGALRQFDKTFQAGAELLAQLDRRLAQLPGFIAAGVSPQIIVAEINAKLKNELARSTIPQTADMLRETAHRIGKVSSEFSAAADSLSNSCRGAAEQARRAIGEMNQSLAKASDTASRAAEQLTTGFHKQYWWSVWVLISVALVLGFVVGILFMHQLNQPAQNADCIVAPVIEPASPIKSKPKK